MKGISLFFLTLLTLSGCSLTVPVIGMIGDGSELFTGTATGGMGGTGSINLIGTINDTKCFGGFTYTRVVEGTGSTGIADIQCDDGRKAQLKFIAESYNKGMGTGFDNFGSPFMFSYGMTKEETFRVFQKIDKNMNPQKHLPSENLETKTPQPSQYF